ncbi:MAG: hypothetical protein ABIH53_03375 [archaeon]
MIGGKRGQATALVIVGILIVSLVVGVSYFYSETISSLIGIGGAKSEEMDNLEASVEVIVTDCLRETAVDGLFFMGIQGGYYELDAPYKMISDVKVPFYFNLGHTEFPEKSKVEQDLSKYVQVNLPACVNFSLLEDSGYSFSKGEVSVSSKIGANDISLNLKYPIVIGKDEFTRKVNEFTQAVDFKFDQIYDLVRQVVEEQKENPNTMPLVFISDLAYKNGFEYVVTQWDEGVMVFTLFFNNSLRPDYYTYAFLANYSSSDVSFLPEDLSEVEAMVENDKAYQVRLYATPSEGQELSSDSTAEEWDLILMSDIDFEDALENNPSLLESDVVFQEFNERLKSLTTLTFFNGNDKIRNVWFGKYGIECVLSCKLFSFDGVNATTPCEKVVFKPSELFGGRVLNDGRVWLPNMASVSAGGRIKKSDGVYTVYGGKTTFSALMDVGPVNVRGGIAVVSKYGPSGGKDVYETIATSDESLTVFIDEEFNPMLIGEDVFVKSLVNNEEAEVLAKFTGGIKIVGHLQGEDYFWKGRYLLNEGTKFTDYVGGNVAATYSVAKETEYYDFTEGCNSLLSRNCIQRSGGELLVLVGDKNNLGVVDFGKSISKFTHVTIRDGSTISFDDGNVEIGFGKSRNPKVVRGSPLDANTGFYQKVNPNLVLWYVPSDSGFYAVKVFVNNELIGSIMEREGVVMNAMKGGVKSQNKWAEELSLKYGGQKPHRVIGFLDDPRELRILHAIYASGDKNGMDPNFLSASAFGEGLVIWMDEYRRDSSTTVDAFGDIGADRFGKEFKSYEQELDIGGVKVEGNKIVATVISITEAGKKTRLDRPREIEMDADVLETVGDFTMAQIRGDLVEIDGKKMKIKTLGLIERGMLRSDFDDKDEFSFWGEETSERGEEIKLTNFKNIEFATEAMGAMLKRRQNLFLGDVRKAGFNPDELSSDEVDYWTYVYYNGGSGPPEDLFGIGRGIVLSRLQRYGIEGLAIPTGRYGEDEVHANAQRIIATKKLLDKANPSMVGSAVLALR